MQDASQLATFEAGHVHSDLRPEMRVAAVNHQPVVILHGLLDIEGEVQRVDAAAKFGSRRLGIYIGMHLCDPFRTALTVALQPRSVSSIARGVSNRDQGIKKGARDHSGASYPLHG